MIRRAVPTLAMSAVLVAAAVITLGRPDLGLAGQFLSGSYPTVESAVAIVSLVSYSVVAVVAIVAVTGAIRAAREDRPDVRRSTRAGMFLLAGIIVLGIGVSHRVTFRYTVCCGNTPQHVTEAASLAR